MDSTARLERIKALLLAGAFFVGATLALHLAVIVPLAFLAVAAPHSIAAIMSSDLRRIPIGVLLALFANRAIASLLLATTFPLPDPPPESVATGAAPEEEGDDREPPLAILPAAL